MTMTFDVDGLAERLPDMLAEVEAGRDVVLARGAVPVATVKREPRRPSPEEAERAIREIKEIRRSIPPTTAEEILAWRDERRR